MTFRAKFATAFLVILCVLPGLYFLQLLPQVGSTPVGQIEYQVPLLAMLVGVVAATVVAVVVISVRSARRNEPVDEEDERDRLIDMRGDQVGSYVLVGAAVAGIGLALAEAQFFWIANGVLALTVAAGIVRCAVVLNAHLRGI